MSLEPPPTELQPVVLIAGRYRVERPIGTGGMGEVIRAFDVSLRRPVAIKRLIPTSGPTGARIEARLLREARSVALLNHPNVIGVYDVGEENGAGFIVMELVENGNLRTRARREPRIPTEQVLDWLLQIADGLACAHRAGLVHRDIKPENLLVGADGRIKIADFGAVKELERSFPAKDASATSGPLTLVGSTIGTPRYMAPEQLRAETVDGRADQFAWGLVAYELIAGIHPYDATATETTCQAVVDGLFVPPPFARGTTDALPGIERVIFRALSAESRDRYPDMGALVDSMQYARKSSSPNPTQTAPPAQAASPLTQAASPSPSAPTHASPAPTHSPPAPTPPPARAHVALCIALACAGLVAVCIVSLYLLTMRRTKAGEDETPDDGLGGPSEIRGKGGKCLDVKGGRTDNFTPAQLFTCNGTEAQLWTLTATGELRGKSDKCLDVQRGATDDGTPVELHTCNGTAAQRWTRTATGELRGKADKCLDVAGGATNDGTPLQLHACNGTAAQKWTLKSN